VKNACHIHAILVVLFVCHFSVHGQFLDSLNHIFRGSSSIDARLESRNSFFRNKLISVTGVRLGVAYKHRLRIGGGFSWLKTNLQDDFFVRGVDNKIDTVSKFFKFAYFCYYIDFVFHKTKRWQLSVPIQAGTGASWFQRSARYSIYNNDKKHFLLLYEPGITAQFKVFKWLGLGSDVGYRFTLRNYKKAAEKLNSPTYSFKLLFWPDQLFFQLFPEQEITKKFGPAEW